MALQHTLVHRTIACLLSTIKPNAEFDPWHRARTKVANACGGIDIDCVDPRRGGLLITSGRSGADYRNNNNKKANSTGE